MGSKQTKSQSTGKSMPKIFGNVRIKDKIPDTSSLNMFISNFHNQARGAVLLLGYHTLQYLPNIVKILLGAFYKKISKQYLHNIGYLPNIVEILLGYFTQNIVCS